MLNGYTIDGSSLPNDERMAIVQAIDKLAFMPIGNPPDIRSATFSFFLEDHVPLDDLVSALRIPTSCPIHPYTPPS